MSFSPLDCSFLPGSPLIELGVRRKMDLGGFLEVEAFVSSSPCSFSPSSDIESSRKKGFFGSHFLKQGKTCRRDKGDDPSSPKTARSIHYSNGGQKRLLDLSSKASSSPLMRSCENPPSCSLAGLHCGSLDANMQGVVRRLMGPFTAPQRMDLEQQMLIYSYISANVPIPTSLLSSLRLGFNPAEPFRPNGVWWGYFHPGFVGNLDPEPSRCRRTDGKKWRCSRDAVPDQKYCERHINRGRHRSRKPVERRGGHVQMSTPVTLNATSSVVSRNHAQSSPDNTSTTTSRSWMVDHQETTRELYPLALNAKPSDPVFSTKLCTPLDERFNSGDEILKQLSVTNNSLVRPLELHYLQNHLSKFPDDVVQDLTRSHTNCSLWTSEGEMQSERSHHQVSLSLPMASPDFSSSTSSPAPETFSPLHMRLGLGGIPNERNPAEEMIWKPSHWESVSIGGPLGEALTSPTDTPMDENQSFLSLMNGSWTMSPPRLASSTGNALQSAAISSVSSGSANDLMVETKTGDGFGCWLFGGSNTLISSSDLSM